MCYDNQGFALAQIVEQESGSLVLLSSHVKMKGWVCGKMTQDHLRPNTFLADLKGHDVFKLNVAVQRIAAEQDRAQLGQGTEGKGKAGQGNALKMHPRLSSRLLHDLTAAAGGKDPFHCCSTSCNIQGHHSQIEIMSKREQPVVDC